MLGRKIIASIAVFAAVGSGAFADIVTTPMSNPSWGYTVTGLGNGNEVALVFTNHLDTTMTWTVPNSIENVRFLVVGGGGGGGGDSDSSTSVGKGGAGGGGGGVITGYVNTVLAESTVVNVTVGAGGAGGKLGESDCASEKGGASSLVVDGIAIVYADGGGNDGGYPNPGGAGGSNGGWRTNADKTVDDPNSGSSYVAQVVTAVMYGNSGGKGYSTAPASSGGGGGAMTAGSPSMSSTNEDNPFYNQDPQRNIAGQGGEGLSSDITGIAVVYGSGGGGGNATTGETGLAAVGGTNAGNGAGKNGTTADYDSSNPVTSSDGGDGVANCGGGGGGAGNNSSESDGNGGNGGSGIVVIRYVDLTLHAHSWSDWTTNTPATCTSDGSRSRTCTACTSEPAATETEVLPALGHNIVIDVDSDGGLVRKCSRCDYSYTASSGWGYKVTGVGTYGNEVALVFTNHTETTSWYVPENLQNVQFLVVGGGGGGGGDSNVNAGGQGGAGGGGGGVITGYVYSVSSGATVAVAVGQGGEGGAASTTSGSNEGDGAAVKGAASSFSIDGTVMVSADGGGRDLGAYSTSEESGGVGGYGGSNAGSRTESHSSTDPNYKSVINNDYVFGEMFGGQGGVAYTEGAYAAGGGGGATEDGGDSVNSVDGSSFWQAGDGGEGLASSITGTEVVYGSGGGGGSGYNKDLDLTAGGAGGDGAGDGSKSADGGDAVANRGGGGGGGGDQRSGGSGGSGVVVLRYVDSTAHAHDYGDWTTTIYASCTTSGQRIRTCQDCVSSPAYVQVEVIPALGHDWGEWTTITPATCTQDGLKKRICNRAGCTAEESQVIPTTGHNYSDEPYLVVEPKFSNYPSHDGVGTNYYGCAGCNAIKEETISALGYVRTGLGDSEREVAVVFTNENAGVITWKMPHGADNVQFLVVGGGGGGGRGVWGGGGGGGGVVTGLVTRLSKNSSVNVVVGAGGIGGDAVPAVNATAGGNSSISVSDVPYVVAKGGGRGAAGQGAGGSGGGCSYHNTTTYSIGGAVSACETNGAYVTAWSFGNVGGGNIKTETSGGGGGGALEAGERGSGGNGGDGGEGLPCDITGELVVYGSGGGGGGYSSRGEPGSGAGRGGYSNTNNSSRYPTAGEANRGGGGGGGGGNYGYRLVDGYNGGSGIVVIRYMQKPPVFKVIVR